MDTEKINKSVKVNIKEDLKLLYPEVFEDNKINSNLYVRLKVI